MLEMHLQSAQLKPPNLSRDPNGAMDHYWSVWFIIGTDIT